MLRVELRFLLFFIFLTGKNNRAVRYKHKPSNVISRRSYGLRNRTIDGFIGIMNSPDLSD